VGKGERLKGKGERGKGKGERGKGKGKIPKLSLFPLPLLPTSARNLMIEEN
jgi:hypothetical protein